jgi:hypothetical protein
MINLYATTNQPNKQTKKDSFKQSATVVLANRNKASTASTPVKEPTRPAPKMDLSAYQEKDDDDDDVRVRGSGIYYEL